MISTGAPAGASGRGRRRAAFFFAAICSRCGTAFEIQADPIMHAMADRDGGVGAATTGDPPGNAGEFMTSDTLLEPASQPQIRTYVVARVICRPYAPFWRVSGGYVKSW
jgi:hypothetical protein